MNYFPKKTTIQKVIFLIPGILLFLTYFYSISQSQVLSDPYYSAPRVPKTTSKLQKKIHSLPAEQETLKVWIYLTDKGIVSEDYLRAELIKLKANLTERGQRRRAKMRSEENLVDYFDLPLFPTYIHQVSSLVKKVRTQSRWFNALSAEVIPAQISQLAELPFVREIDLVNAFKRNEPLPDRASKESFQIPDLEYGNSFHQLNQLKVPKVHQLGYSGQGILVCLLDTGFNTSHPAFQQATIIAQWDFVNNDNDVKYDPLNPADYSDYHGTATWSLLGGYAPGELVGPAYRADFLLAKTENAILEEPIEEDYWVAGMEWADSFGVEVISSSLGYIDWYTFEDMDGNTAITTRAADRAVNLGIVIVTAAGNERNDPWGHIIAPADAHQVIAVGAVDSTGNIAYFSSPGPTYDGRIKPEVCAQGVNNYIAYSQITGETGFTTGSGTSFSTPLVAGVAALLLEVHPDWTPLEVRAALMNTASQKDNPNNDYGWGIVDALAASQLTFNKKGNPRR